METNVNYTVVGTFVILLITAIVMGIIWLSSGFTFDQYSLYMVYMQESISGLNVDAPVEYNGVNVGTVKNIEISQKNPQLVELLLRIKDKTPITRGTEATLSTRGLTGMVYIALKDKSTDLRPLKASPGQEYPVIKTAPSIFVRIETALGQVSVSLQQVTQSIRSVLNPQNQKAIRDTLQHIEHFTNTLSENTDKFNEILANMAIASGELTPLLQSGQRTIKMLELQALPLTYQTLQNLNNMSRTLSDVATSLKQNPSILIRGQTLTPGPGESP